MIKVLIADDELLAREELSHLLEQDKQFEIVGTASSGRDALEKLKKKETDVVFLDIEMPGLSGLEVASRLSEWENPPLVIFATAYDEYAFKAFEANAIDYILKPYDAKRFQKTLERIKELLKNKTPSKPQLVSLEKDLILQGILKKIVGHKRNSKERMIIDPGQVYYFFANLSEVLAHLENEEFILNATLKDLVEKLDPSVFIQTHKAYLVNLNKIEKVSPLFSGNFQITLKDPKKSSIPLSRRYAANLKRCLGGW